MTAANTRVAERSYHDVFRSLSEQFKFAAQDGAGQRLIREATSLSTSAETTPEMDERRAAREKTIRELHTYDAHLRQHGVK